MHQIHRKRKLDSLGRLILPADIRERAGLRPFDPVEINVEDDRITLTKISNDCYFCGSSEQLTSYMGVKICKSCLDLLGEEMKKSE